MNLLARRALILLVLALPAWAWALDFGFRPPRDPDDAAAVQVMRDLAQRVVPVYQDADTEVFLANVTALQIVSGDLCSGLRQQQGPAPPPPRKAVRRPGRARASRRHLCACARDGSEGSPRLRQGLHALVPGTGAAARQRAGRGRHDAARGSAGVVPGARPAGLRSLALAGQHPAGRRRGARARLARVRVASQLRRAAARADRGGEPQPLRGEAGRPDPGGRGCRHSCPSGPARPRERRPADAPALHARSRRGRRAAQRLQGLRRRHGVRARSHARWQGRRVAVRARRRRRRGRDRLDRPAAVERRPRRHARRGLLRLRRLGRRAQETGGAQGHRHDRADGPGDRLPDGRTDLSQRHGSLGAGARDWRAPASRRRRRPERELAGTRRGLVSRGPPLLGRGQRPAGRPQRAHPNLADAPQS